MPNVAQVTIMEKFAATEATTEQFLASHFGGNVGGVAEIGRGEWSQAYSFRHLDADLVIRFSRFDEDFLKDRWAERFNA